MRRTARGAYAIAERGASPVLHGAIDARYITGPLTAALASMLNAPEAHRGDPALEALRELGLLDPAL